MRERLVLPLAPRISALEDYNTEKVVRCLGDGCGTSRRELCSGCGFTAVGCGLGMSGFGCGFSSKRLRLVFCPHQRGAFGIHIRTKGALDTVTAAGAVGLVVRR
ncbi:hypothetical protein Tco_0464084 [Tanacetum coccineum]